MSERTVEDVDALLRLVERVLAELDGTAVTECELQLDGRRVLVRRSPGPAAGGAASPEPSKAVPASWRPITAPLTGVFYASPAPQEPPFVSVGAEIAAGQVVGQIESMKMYNLIESELTGIVRAIVVENAAVVTSGQVLLYVELAGEEP